MLTRSSSGSRYLIQAIAGCSIPVIAAIGHQTDRTLTDFVADRTVPTPSAAAEICTPSRQELRGWAQQRGLRCRGGRWSPPRLRHEKNADGLASGPASVR
ncbi:MAG: exodeoxyribonuclease VII large subunit [Dehalococcoidia bacterium]